MAKYIEKCPECGSKELEYDEKRGEIVCKNCGLVLEESKVDLGQEWREFDWEQAMKKRRAGSPLTKTKPDKGLTTKVGEAGDVYKLSSDQRKKYFKYRKWQRRISTPIERNIKLALAELRRVSSYLNLPSVVTEESARTYRKAAARGLVRGRSMEAMVAGALYAACKEHEVPRTLDEIAEAFPLTVKEVGKTYRFVCRQLDIRILPPDPLNYVPRFADELNLPVKVESEAIDIVKQAKSRSITSGKGPTGIAAAALYVSTLMHGEKRTQRRVAEVAGVTEVTIRNRYKELIEKLELGNKVGEVD